MVERPAFTALQVFLRQVGTATFTHRIAADNAWWYMFEADGGGRVAVGYAMTEQPAQAPFAGGTLQDMYGASVPTEGEQIVLGGAPVYLVER